MLGNGPLGNGGIGAVLCNPGSLDRPITLGFFAFQNTGHAAAMITKADLADPHGMRAVGIFYVVPITTTTEIGDWPTFPPRLPASLRLPWSQRRPAVGARLAPGRTHWNLVLGLQPTSSESWSDGIDLWYTEGGSRYYLRTGTRLRVAVYPARC